MRYDTKNKELNERAIANATELSKLEEPPVMTTYLWCKVQSMAESILAAQKEKKEILSIEIYKAVMNKRCKRITRFGLKSK